MFRNLLLIAVERKNYTYLDQFFYFISLSVLRSSSPARVYYTNEFFREKLSKENQKRVELLAKEVNHDLLKTFRSNEVTFGNSRELTCSSE